MGGNQASNRPPLQQRVTALLIAGVLASASVIPAHAREPSKLCRPQQITPITVDATVVGISDGDTLKARFPADMAYPGQQSVRLLEIDAPESGQPFGARAKQALSALAFGQTLRFVVRGHDRYCRPLALVSAPGAPSGAVNFAMVQQGFAWANREYGRDAAYPLAEKQARAARLGLWADREPVYPGDFRRAKRAGAGDQGAAQ